MKDRFYPIDTGLFEAIGEPLISKHYKRPGRPLFFITVHFVGCYIFC